MSIYKHLVEQQRFVDLYKLCRFTYRMEQPIVDDARYEKLNAFIIKYNLTDLHKQTYDDDEIPYELLKEFNFEHLIYRNDSDRSEYVRYLDGEKSLSIKSVESYNDAYDFFKNVSGARLIISTKVNGINTKSLYPVEKGGALALSMSRGRKGNGFDLTKNLSKRIPISINNQDKDVIVYAEAFVRNDKLEFVSKFNKEPLVTERSAAISMLRKDYPGLCYEHLYALAFNAEGLSNSISDTLSILESNGFDIVPYRVIDENGVPSDYDEFCTWLKSNMDSLYKEQVERGIPADGLVVQVDDLHFDESISNQYSNRNIALKFEHWSYRYYKGIVEDIIIEQKSVDCSVRLKLKTMTTEDNCEANYVNVFSVGVLISEGIVKGSEIYFERNSGAINILVYGARLDEMLGKRTLHSSNNF